MRSPRIAACLVFSVTTIATALPAAAAPGAADYLPDDVFLAVHLNDAGGQVDIIRRFLEQRRFAESPIWDAFELNPELVQLRIFLLGLAQTVGTDVWSGVASLLGEELAFGLVPKDDKQPDFIAVVMLGDPTLVDRIIASVHAAVGAAGQVGADKAEVMDGVRVVEIGPRLLQCRTDAMLIVASDRSLIHDAIGRAGIGEGLTSTAMYRAARDLVPEEAHNWAFVNPAILRTALAGDGTVDVTRMPEPLPGFLFGGWWHDLVDCDQLVVWTTPIEGGVSLHASATAREPLAETHAGFVHRPVDRMTRITIDDAIAELSLVRGWAGIFSERESIFNLSAASDIANFVAQMTTLMGRADFVDDLMARIAGPVQLFVRRREFGVGESIPTPRLPGFALVAPLRIGAAADLRQRLDSAALMIFSFINMDASQKDGPSYVVDIELHRGHRVVTMSFAERDSGGDALGPMAASPVEIRYNFAPAAALIDDYYVLASTHDLMYEIIDAIEKEKRLGSDADEVRDRLVIDTGRVFTALNDNREELIVSRMLKEDQSRADAARDIDAILALLGFFDRVELEAHKTPVTTTVKLLVTGSDSPSNPD